MQLHIETAHFNFSQSHQPTMVSSFIEALVRKAMEVEDDQPVDAEIERQATGTIPAIGAYWPGQGGIYAGVARGRDGEADYHLILCQEAPTQGFTWQAALDLAKTITADGHSDFIVPTRFESALLYANLQDQFDTDHWYWTSTQCSETRAWGQCFGNGDQLDGGKGYERRVRFARRLAL